MPKIGIASVGTSVPDKILTNADLELMVDTSDEWIFTRTGIRERHVLDREEGLRPHVHRAAKTAMDRAGVGPADLDFILSSVIVPDRFCPAQSYELAHDLGANRVFCLDLNVACSGFVYGLLHGMPPQECVEMGAAHGALLQSTRGDTSMVTMEELKHVMGGGSARIKR
mgnify:CR=1 FL=1